MNAIDRDYERYMDNFGIQENVEDDPEFPIEEPDEPDFEEDYGW